MEICDEQLRRAIWLAFEVADARVVSGRVGEIGPTGAGGTPPNRDVVIIARGGMVIGVES
jgi:hypothetical protein